MKGYVREHTNDIAINAKNRKKSHFRNPPIHRAFAESCGSQSLMFNEPFDFYKKGNIFLRKFGFLAEGFVSNVISMGVLSCSSSLLPHANGIYGLDRWNSKNSKSSLGRFSFMATYYYKRSYFCFLRLVSQSEQPPPPIAKPIIMPI